jgi:hypothetical protein
MLFRAAHLFLCVSRLVVLLSPSRCVGLPWLVRAVAAEARGGSARPPFFSLVRCLPCCYVRVWYIMNIARALVCSRLSSAAIAASHSRRARGTRGVVYCYSIVRKLIKQCVVIIINSVQITVFKKHFLFVCYLAHIPPS